MARYVYAVVNLTQGLPENVTNIPNLGIHSNLKSAIRHFNSCVKHRQDMGDKLIWDQRYYREFETPRYVVHREAYFHCKDCRETLRLEKWKLT